jgi:FkbM family methyltransferase
MPPTTAAVAAAIGVVIVTTVLLLRSDRAGAGQVEDLEPARVRELASASDTLLPVHVAVAEALSPCAQAYEVCRTAPPLHLTTDGACKGKPFMSPVLGGKGRLMGFRRSDSTPVPQLFVMTAVKLRSDESGELARQSILNTGGIDQKDEMPVFIMNKLTKPLVYIDVGANRGTTSLPVVAHTSNHTVFSFEPVPLMVSELCLAWQLAGGYEDRWHIIAGVASDKDGESSVFVPEGREDNTASSASGATLNVGTKYAVKEVKVNSVRIDTLIAAYKIDRVAVLKIDTQGHELFVVRGAEQSLRAKKIRLVYAENDAGLQAQAGVDANAVFDFMQSVGYDAYRPRILSNIVEDADGYPMITGVAPLQRDQLATTKYNTNDLIYAPRKE